MKKLMLAVAMIVSVASFTVKAEEVSSSHDAAPTTNTAPVSTSTAPVKQEDKSLKLLEMISACMADRPSVSTEDILSKISR